MSGHCVWENGISGNSHKHPQLQMRVFYCVNDVNANKIKILEGRKFIMRIILKFFMITQLEEEKIKERLTKTMYKRRKELKLKQREVAGLLGKEEKTYQRLESTGNGLSNFFDILDIFRVLHFSVNDIIYVLELPPLTLREIEELYQDEETLKNIREKGIHSSIRQTCGKMETITIERVLCTLMAEYLKRKG